MKSVIKIKIIVLVLIIILASCVIYTNNDAYAYESTNNQIVSVKDMKTDFDFLVNFLKKNQPKMKDNPSKYNGIINSIYKSIKKPMYKEDFFWKLNDLFIAIKDAHTNITEFNNDDIALPALVYTKTGVYACENESGLKIGDQIISIGGKQMNEILDDMNSVVPAEIPDYVRANINRISNGMVLRKLKLINKENKVAVEYKRDNQVNKVNIDFINNLDFFNRIQHIANMQNENINAEKDQIPNWILYKETNLAVIKFNVCIKNKTYEDCFQKFFNEVNDNNITNVAVDLRDNDGGSDDIIDLFLSYTSIPEYIKCAESEISPNTPTNIRDITNKDPSPYQGKIYLLTSNRTYSAATDFVLTLKVNNIAKIIGQSPGNIPNFCGRRIGTALPKTKIYFGCGTNMIEWHVLKSGQYKPIEPDYFVEYSKDDLINEIDPWIKKAMELSSK